MLSLNWGWYILSNSLHEASHYTQSFDNLSFHESNYWVVVDVMSGLYVGPVPSGLVSNCSLPFAAELINYTSSFRCHFRCGQDIFSSWKNGFNEKGNADILTPSDPKIHHIFSRGIKLIVFQIQFLIFLQGADISNIYVVLFLQGMAVLRLLRGFLGWDEFRRGLQVCKNCLLSFRETFLSTRTIKDFLPSLCKQNMFDELKRRSSCGYLRQLQLYFCYLLGIYDS